MYGERSHPLFSAMRVPVRLRWLVLGWLLAEVVVFGMLVRGIGLGGTMLLGLVTTVLGVVLLRRAGGGALRSLRRATAGGVPPNGSLLDGLLAALGAVLLIIPGFVANAAGLVLSAPSARRALAVRFGPAAPTARGSSARQGVIDLGPEDWRPVDRL